MQVPLCPCASSIGLFPCALGPMLWGQSITPHICNLPPRVTLNVLTQQLACSLTVFSLHKSHATELLSQVQLLGNWACGNNSFLNKHTQDPSLQASTSATPPIPGYFPTPPSSAQPSTTQASSSIHLCSSNRQQLLNGVTETQPSSQPPIGHLISVTSLHASVPWCPRVQKTGELRELQSQRGEWVKMLPTQVPEFDPWDACKMWKERTDSQRWSLTFTRTLGCITLLHHYIPTP